MSDNIKVTSEKTGSYNIIFAGPKTIVTTKYNGQTVRGVANCHPHDFRDEDIGIALASSRCDQKLWNKKIKSAKATIAEAEAEMRAAALKYGKACDFLKIAEGRYKTAVEWEEEALSLVEDNLD